MVRCTIYHLLHYGGLSDLLDQSTDKVLTFFNWFFKLKCFWHLLSSCQPCTIITISNVPILTPSEWIYLPVIWWQLEPVHSLYQSKASALMHRESSFQSHILEGLQNEAYLSMMPPNFCHICLELQLHGALLVVTAWKRVPFPQNHCFYHVWFFYSTSGMLFSNPVAIHLSS